MIILKNSILINNMFVNIYKIMESYNNNYIYINFVTNQHQFYFKYNRSGGHIQSIFIKKVKN